MDIVTTDVVDPKSDICLTSDPKQSQTESDLTSCIADRVVDKGPAESLPPRTGLAPGGQTLVRETGPPGRVLVCATGSHGQVLVRETGSHGQAFTKKPPVGMDDSYEVTWTVEFAVAVPRGEEEVKREGRGPRAEAPSEGPAKPQSYYHLEARLLPGLTEPLKADLVVMGPVVRIYRDNESKTLRTWCEGDRMWVSWSHSFRVSVTRELLEALLSHTILLRVVEGRDKVGSRARNDRPKAFRPLLARSEDDADGCVVVRDRVSWLREVTERDPSKMSKKKKSHTKAEIQRPPEEKSHKLGRSVKLQEQSKDTITLANQNNKTLAASHKSGLQPYETALDLENIKKNGLAWVECRPLCLVAGATSLAERFSVVRPSAVFEALCNISLDRALMSEQLKAELNPLVITILSANSLPSTPIPFPVLREKCLPVYCQYQFHELKMHKTKPQRHGAHVHFDDVLVVLAGSMGRGGLRQYLTGPPLEIQVHDRDRKPQQAPVTSGLFGTRPDDSQLSSVAFVARKRTAQDPAVNQVYESYGVAHLDLSGLVLGQRSFKVTLPIRGGPPPQLLGRERPMWERKMTDLPGDADGRGKQPLEQGHYFDSNAHLKVKVELAHPLLWDADPAVGSDEHPAFGRVVFVFGSNNVDVLTKLRSEILKINAAAFNIGSCSSVSLDRVLSEYPLSPEESESKELDFVTGFHVQDEQRHLVVVEGLRHKAVKLLWETIPQKLGGCTEEQVRVLYSSGMGFFKRIYGSLDVGLSPVHLHRPLEDIMGNPQVYVRDMLPLSTFQALTRLSQLCQASRLLEAVRGDLLPTVDMIRSVSRDLGTVPGRTKQEIRVEEEEEEVGNTEVSSSLSARERKCVPLDMNNTEFKEWKKRIKHTLDYVKENIREVQLRSGQIQKPRRAEFGPEPAEFSQVHNYSIQTFNSHRRGLELLREEMAKEPGRRFTYSQLYQSATLEPGGFTDVPRGNGAAFDFYSPREYPPHPDQARVEELRKPWEENILHANTLRSPLTRDRWPWCRRSLDFQLYPSAPPYFGPPPPVPARLAREGPEQEHLLQVVGHQGGWTREVLPSGGSVPDDHSQRPDFRFYRGAGSGKLRDILKDEPRKYSLRTPGLALQPLPALAVLGGGSDEDPEAQCKALAPGPFPERNLTAAHNAIPRRPSQYQRYRFTRYCVPRSLLHKRRAAPLTEAERACLSAAASPDAETHRKNQGTTTGPFNTVVEVRTHREVALYTQ
ncbi:uncharacterized protein cfap92 [Gadus chalcogrammus]|uniref:uncharacterized protein cfap92 n=1 Tax=Gadus chalcogrammus TaxID=1042646 RepID=UPI0024C4BF71|nr:uncharacterized protein cfap92 [Gadus chalcogrammus]